MLGNLLLLPTERKLSCNQSGETIASFMDVLAPELSADMQVPSGHCNGLSDWGQTTQSPARTLARMPVFPIPRKLQNK